MKTKSFIPAAVSIWAVLSLGLDAEVKSGGGNTPAAANNSQIIVVRGVTTGPADPNCIRILKSDKTLTQGDYGKIQEYLRQKGKDKLVVQSPPDNMPVVLPNTSYYNMPTKIPDTSNYQMPIIKPQTHNQKGLVERKRK